MYFFDRCELEYKVAHRLVFQLLIAAFASLPAVAMPAREAATTPVMAHYMPWYQSPPTSSKFGWHWTMDSFSPDYSNDKASKIESNSGKLKAASYYTPLIGLYDSSDQDAIEYEALLMKLSGLDGAIIDWYGDDDFLDYGINNQNSLKFMEELKKVGLSFALMYEDSTVKHLISGGIIKPDQAVQHGRALFQRTAQKWFSDSSYLKMDDRPVLLMFGPQYYSPSALGEVLQGLETKPALFTLHKPVGPAIGGFDWMIPKLGITDGAHMIADFYQRSKPWAKFITVAYPRFHDVYEQAGVNHSWGSIDDANGLTYRQTLDKALSAKGQVVQIATWNDWGEGTQIEPSQEFGYRDLEYTLQALRSVRHTHSTVTPTDLRIPERIYDLRKRYSADSNVQAILNSAVQYLCKGKMARARAIVSALEAKR